MPSSREAIQKGFKWAGIQRWWRTQQSRKEWKDIQELQNQTYNTEDNTTSTTNNSTGHLRAG